MSRRFKMYQVKKELMDKLVMAVGNQQNDFDKLNAGQIREMISIILKAFVVELFGGTHEQPNQGNKMPAKKKGAVKKTKPMPKPKAK